MLNITITTSYVFSIISFGLFLYLAIKQQIKKENSAGIGLAEEQGAIEDMANLINALSKLTDSFAKAGPMVMSLVAAIFFLLIAVVGSGIESLSAIIS